MRKNLLMAMPALLAALALAACDSGDPRDTVTVALSYGASPELPKPQHAKIPTLNVAKAVGWPAGAKPKAADGMAVTAFATGLDHPRSVYVLPNGDVLVAETEGFCGADIAGVCHYAALKALRRAVEAGGGKETGDTVELQITEADLLGIIEEVR